MEIRKLAVQAAASATAMAVVLRLRFARTRLPVATLAKNDGDTVAGSTTLVFRCHLPDTAKREGLKVEAAGGHAFLPTSFNLPQNEPITIGRCLC